MANNTVPEFGKRAAVLRATHKSEPEPGRRLPGTAGRIYAELQDEDVEPVAVKTPEEIPGWSEEDYQNYKKAQGREGDWSAPEMRNPDNDVYSRIARGVGKIKRLPGTLSYYAHKVADPMFANVDYMGRHLGEWGAKKINNIARAFDISPGARQYGRFEEEEYDPENVDVRFGKNAYKEGYDSLGDYLEAKDQEKVDRYRGYNHADRFADIEKPDDKWYSLSDTQTMEDWQPESTAGKIAKGVITTAGDMLPQNLEMLAAEKGIEGGAKMLGMLTPLGMKYQRLRRQAEAATDRGDFVNSDIHMRRAHDTVEQARRAKRNGENIEYIGADGTRYVETITPEMRRARGAKPVLREYRKARELPPLRKEEFENQEFNLANYASQQQQDFMAQKINEARARNWKPLPNPAAQREAAVAGSVRQELNEVAKEWEGYNSWREWNDPAGKESALREVGETLKQAKNPVSRRAMLEYAKTNPGGGDLDLNTISTIERSVAEDLSRGIPKEDAIIRAQIRCIDPYELADEGAHGVLEAFEQEGVLYSGDTGWDYTDVFRTGERVKNAATTAAAEAPRAAATSAEITSGGTQAMRALKDGDIEDVKRVVASVIDSFEGKAEALAGQGIDLNDDVISAMAKAVKRQAGDKIKTTEELKSFIYDWLDEL